MFIALIIGYVAALGFFYPWCIMLATDGVYWLPRVFGGWAGPRRISLHSAERQEGTGAKHRALLHFVYHMLKGAELLRLRLLWDGPPQCIVKASSGDIISSAVRTIRWWRRRRHGRRT